MTTSPTSSARSERTREIAERVRDIRQRIETLGKSPDSVRIVAVTKSFGAMDAQAAVDAGLVDLGENYLDELAEKQPAVSSDVRWHFLGALQSRKIPEIARIAHSIDGVCRKKELDGLARCAQRPELLIQVDTTGLSQRNGAPVDEVADLVNYARRLELPVAGLMTVAPEGPGAATCFSIVAGLAQELGLSRLSMGMSGDWEDAVAAGSNEIRIGRALLGPRAARHRAQ